MEKLKKTMPRRPATMLVEFGGITMRVPKPTKTQYRKNIAEGVKALSLLPSILSKPGVKLVLRPDLPSYVADGRDPSLVVQTVGKILRRGRFDQDGQFVEVE